jgi:hypothetical protein
MRQLETSGLGGVGAAPAASQTVPNLAAESSPITQMAHEFQDVGLCWLASCLARRHRVALSVATVAAEQRWRP